MCPLSAWWNLYLSIHEEDCQENNVPKTMLLRVIQTMGWAMGMNLMVLGFVFSDHLGDAMAPIFIILLLVDDCYRRIYQVQTTLHRRLST